MGIDGAVQGSAVQCSASSAVVLSAVHCSEVQNYAVQCILLQRSALQCITVQ